MKTYLKHFVALMAVLYLNTLNAQLIHTIYPAKKIITIDPNTNDSIYALSNPAVAVFDGKITDVGSFDNLKSKYLLHHVDSSFINNVLMPGFVEAHSHLQIFGMYANLPYTGFYTRPGLTDSLKGITSSSDMIEYLKTQLPSNPALPLFAWGADPIYFNGTRFTSNTLDSVSKTTPIMMQLGSGHIIICNTPMLTILQKDSGWASLPYNSIIKYPGSLEPTGELDESQAEEFALSVFNKAYKKIDTVGFYSVKRLTEGITNGARLMRNAGVTTATEMLFDGASKAEFLGNRVIYDVVAPFLPIRVVLAYSGLGLSQIFNGDMNSCINFLNTQKGNDSAHLLVGPVKFVADGSIQGYTAQISGQYINQPSNPYWNTPPGQFVSLMKPFLDNGYSLAIHTNGQIAVDTVLYALNQIKPTNPNGIWATLEHAQLIDTAHYLMIKNQLPGVGLNLFTNHLYYYGREHALFTVGYNWVTQMNNVHMADSLQIPYSVHSDAPVTPAMPLFATWTATTRTSAASPGGTYSNTTFGTPITIQKALQAITIGGAQLLNLDNVIGTITPGKYADFAILGADPYNLTNGMQLKDIPVIGTLKSGVFSAADKLSSVKKKQ